METPQPRTRRRRSSDARDTHEAAQANARAVFLTALAAGATIGKAAWMAGVSRRTVYNWRDTEAAFAAEWDDAYEDGTDVFEDEAHRRAVEGVERPVVAMGRLAKDDDGNVLKVREFSDTLLLASLKRRRPDAWRERSTQDVNLKGDLVVESPRERLASRIAGLVARSAEGGDPGGPDGG
jgi:Homeodomain-like domain